MAFPLEVDGATNLLDRRGRIPPGRARSGGPGHLHVVDVGIAPARGVVDLSLGTSSPGCPMTGCSRPGNREPPQTRRDSSCRLPVPVQVRPNPLVGVLHPTRPRECSVSIPIATVGVCRELPDRLTNRLRPGQHRVTGTRQNAVVPGRAPDRDIAPAGRYPWNCPGTGHRIGRNCQGFGQRALPAISASRARWDHRP